MTYAEKLKDPRWQKKRLEILERDEWKCKFCTNEKATLHVHHVVEVYTVEPWEHPENNLICLCDNCHKVHHIVNKLSDFEQELFYLIFHQIIGNKSKMDDLNWTILKYKNL